MNLGLDSTKIDLAVSLLQGTALTWWRQLIRNAAQRPTTFEDFKRALSLQFRTDDEARLARDKLAQLIQGKGTVEAYSTHSALDLYSFVFLIYPKQKPVTNIFVASELTSRRKSCFVTSELYPRSSVSPNGSIVFRPTPTIPELPTPKHREWMLITWM
jgi:hypothetical protein